MPAIHPAIQRLLIAVVSLSFVGASCGPSALGVMPGVLNDTHNLSLRRAILAYGGGHVCDEMLSRSLPLRFHDEDPVAGRFFPGECAARELPNGDQIVQFTGQGYIWTNVSQRLGFGASGAVEYDTDFLLDGSTMYLYFRPRAGAPPTFVARFIELPPPPIFGALFGGASFVNGFGAQIMQSQLVRGFTVIRAANGSIEYGVGVVPPGVHPPTAYRILDPDQTVLANERSDVHTNERDFAGPFAVPQGKKLDLVIGVDGVPAIDVLLVPRSAGEAWLSTYTSQPATTPPPEPPLLDEVVTAGVLYRRTVAVPPGLYYLVLDNTATAGRTAPVTVGRGAMVSYAVALE
jgi:hypothetical protein